MKKRELIDALSDLPDDCDVFLDRCYSTCGTSELPCSMRMAQANSLTVRVPDAYRPWRW